MATFDVIVVGLGGAGSSAVYHLARRGIRVLGIDQAGPANDSGSSHGGSRIVRLAYAEGPDFVPLLLRAHELWDELGDVVGQPVLHRCGVLFIGRPGSEVVADTLASARDYKFTHETLSASQLRLRSPRIAVVEDVDACLDPRAGIVVPEEVVKLHSRLAGEHGATLHYNEPLVEWSASEAGAVARTTSGTHEAGYIVFCSGAWSTRLLGALVRPLRVQRQVQHWFEVLPEHAAAFDPACFPVHVWDDDHLFYCMPMLDGSAGGLKCCLERNPPETTPEQIDRSITPEEIATVQRTLGYHLPGIAGRWLRSSVCMYAATADNRFLIGPIPGAPRVVMAAGLGGHGFKFTPAIGELVADIVEQQANPARFARFDPARFVGVS
jgi:sarcosine oxidase